MGESVASLTLLLSFLGRTFCPAQSCNAEILGSWYNVGRDFEADVAGIDLDLVICGASKTLCSSDCGDKVSSISEGSDEEMLA